MNPRQKSSKLWPERSKTDCRNLLNKCNQNVALTRCHEYFNKIMVVLVCFTNMKSSV